MHDYRNPRQRHQQPDDRRTDTRLHPVLGDNTADTERIHSELFSDYHAPRGASAG